MTDLNHYRQNGVIHFIGCLGAGSRPLMNILRQKGFRVSGSDLLLSGHCAENLPDVPADQLLVIYSSAVSDENPELAEARRRGAECILRGEALGAVAALYPKVIAVSGSHGKTSVSALIVHILKECGMSPGYLVGAEVHTWKESGDAGDGSIFVCEADESDGTHTAVRASTAVVTNVEDDHVWNFASKEVLYDNFRKFAGQAELLVTPERELFQSHPHPLFLEKGAAVADPRFFRFGKYQRINCFTAIETVAAMGLFSRERAADAALSFPGVARRMTKHFDGNSFTLIEDYAHHPTELALSLETLREQYPGRPMTVIFQPHRFARLKRYFQEFVQVLSRADQVFVTPVFAAWTSTSDVNSSDLAEAVHGKAVEGTWEEMAQKVFDLLPENALVAVIGAGDVKEILRPLMIRMGKLPDTGVIIAAGGSSERFGVGNKLLRRLGDMPIISYCIRSLLPSLNSPDRMVVAVPEHQQKLFHEILDPFQVQIVSGGKTRTESVRNALSVMPEGVSVVAVHDGARPFVTGKILRDCVEACRKSGGGVAAERVTDTVKSVDEENFVTGTVARESLRTVQTPQTFHRATLEKCYALAEKNPSVKFTDDSSLVEYFAPEVKIQLVISESPNFKITYPGDLRRAEKYLGELS